MSDAEAPPVPAIPESVNMAAAKARGGSRPKSLGFVSTPVKTASQRMADKGQGGTWFGAAKVGDLGSVRKSDAAMRTPAPQTQQVQAGPQQEEPRPESRGSSINFSYPGRARVASPTPGVVEEESHEHATASKPKKRSSTLSPQRGGPARSARPASIASDRELVYDPNSRRMVSRAELQALEQTARPKKNKTSLNRAGSHLARGTMGRSQGLAVDNGGPNEAQMAAAASLKSHRLEERQQMPEDREECYEEQHGLEYDTEKQSQELERPLAPEPPIRHTEISMSPASNAPELFTPPLPDQHEGGLQRRPSMVREESESSQSEAELEAPTSTAAALDAVPVRHSVYPHGVPSPPQSENTDDQVPVELAAASTSSSEPAAILAGKPERRETQSLRRQSRAHSNSPVRSAHFGPVQETLTVKHEPPMRSLSPRKSALKRSPSRGASPTGDRSDVSGVDTPTQEPPPQRKKSVRVSFDDGKTIVLGEAAGRGEADSPVPPSPQQVTIGARKPWYSTLGIGRKKDAVPLEEDEVMKPRPALPMFGSVRGRKVSPLPVEERALVTPHEPFEEVSESPSPELDRRMLASVDAGQSSDHALGAIVSSQGARTTEANISKQREPLPPVVTSIEGNGYISDSASSADEAALLADTPKLQAEESVVSQASTLVPPTDSGPQQKATEVKDFGAESGSVPSISLTQPSPQPEETERKRESYLRFPGEFPETETETDGESVSAPARQVTFEPVVQQEDAKITAHTPATVLATQPAVQEPEDDSGEGSIYSDAHEDFSDVEGDGFLSLDAVVDSSVLATPPRHVLEKANAQRAEMVTPTPQSRGLAQTSGSEPEDQWAAAKAYWRSLTADKRAQLEKEAVEEAGIEADLEDVQPEAKKPRRKKSVEQRNAEKKAIEQQRIAGVVADPSRTYMIKPGTKAGPDEYVPPSVEASEPRAQQQQLAHEKTGSGMRLRKSMRAAPEPQPVETGTHMRKSMRGTTEPQPVETGTHMRKSMRASAETEPVQSGTHMRKSMRTQPVEPQAPRQRPVSLQPLGITTEISSNNTKHNRAASESFPAAAVLQSSLRRRGSDSSASSFRRARPATSSGGFSFRTSMRAGTGGSSSNLQEPSEPQTSGHRFSLRGASPPVSMRTTLRGERRRSNDSGNSYLRFPGSSGKANKKGKQKSRFGDDSSDEDEGLSRRFTSRFVDSSDEDVAPAEPLPSLRTKTMRSGRKGPPSPPLPEEEELSEEEAPAIAGNEEKTPGVISADTSLRRSRSGRGLDAAPRKRGSFMSSVLRRNKKHNGTAKISRPEPMESAARRDTNLERSADELIALRTNSGHGNPKWHKRIASMPTTNQQDWPLGLDQQRTHDTIGDEDKDVFYDAADGQEAAAIAAVPRSPSVLGHSKSQSSIPRPTFLTRRTISANGTINTDGIGGEGGEVTRKKKKFGALRKMFRLDE